ncbi:DUF742 domain-containing protein [Nocardiopsis salina]|uniref:DUF742 domain-containing protein n=1 Tax=Nocardiopsis salina TaxID=245836 RepID=UPI000345F56F|nr:DUF742 domain-containing protein [Nocardiopsis salina]
MTAPRGRGPGTPWAGGRGHPRTEVERGTAPVGDSTAGPLVRPYTMTKGRTRPDSDGGRLDLITLVVTVADREDRTREPEHEAILRLCCKPVSVAEVSARLDVPLTVVRVLLSDLLAQGDLRTRVAAPVTKLPEKKVLQAVLDGIRRL